MRDQQRKGGSEQSPAVGLRALLLTIVLTAAALYALLSYFPADFSTYVRAEVIRGEGGAAAPASGVDFERLTDQDSIGELNERVHARLAEADDAGLLEDEGDATGRWFFPGLPKWRRSSIEIRWDSARDALLLAARSNFASQSRRGAELALEELSALIQLQIERDVQARLCILDREISELRARADSLEAEIENFQETYQQALDSNLSQVARVQARFHELNPKIGRLQVILGRLREVSSVQEFREIGPLSDLLPSGHPALELEERLLAMGGEGTARVESESPGASERGVPELLTQLTRHLRQFRNEMIEERQRQLVTLSEFRTGPEATRQLNRLNRRLVDKLEQLDELELHRAELAHSLRASPEVLTDVQIPSRARREAVFSPLQRSVMAGSGGLLAAFLVHLAAVARAGRRKPQDTANSYPG